MPSPFPGMDPYLEAPYHWPDLHDRFAGQISTDLNATLPAPYYAKLEMRPEVGIVESDEPRRHIVPDVALARDPFNNGAGGGVAVLEGARKTTSPSRKMSAASETIRHPYIEVRDAEQGHVLITLIEIASPSNKKHGPDRQAYLQKQQQVFESNASLIELDLLRAGDRLLANPFLQEYVYFLNPAPDYLVVVNRAWERGGAGMTYEIFPIPLTEMLPCIPVPLREGQEETPLDLQYAFQRAYDGGPYRRGAVDYGQPPQPPLTGEWAAWAEEKVRAWRAR
jgi:Protein of unknown function (DUF4058)